jgi:hypothetical protein
MESVRQTGKQRLPKLRNAGRTKNLKGGAINFLVACLAPGLCFDVRVNSSAPSRRHFGGDLTRVGGKLSDTRVGSRRRFGANNENA